MIASENTEQRALVQYLSLHPLLKNYFCKLHNEGKRTQRQGYNLKLAGLRPGVSDLFIYYPVGKFCGLWLEVKKNKRYCHSEMMTSTWKNQEEFQKNVRDVGYAAYFAFGWLNAKDIIEKYLDKKSYIHATIRSV